jgi:adenylate kinase family enzyme
MSGRRIIIYGNAGSGKTTMARALALTYDIPRLCLDQIAWGSVTAVRRPLPESIALLEEFIATHPDWVIEGCYGDLVEVALPHCTELHFLNPGTEACIRNSRNRPWDPEYCDSPEQQQSFLEPLIKFIREYETRQDEYSLARHRAIFEAFKGPKQEYN